MRVQTEEDIKQLIRQDKWRMECLRTVREQQLPDGWLAAGFVRNAVWDELHNYTKRTPLNDIDVVYFDLAENTTEKEIAKQLETALPGQEWELVNQATVHTYNNHKPYTSSADAISYCIETATCVGIRLEEDDTLTLMSTQGIDDLVNGIVRLNPNRPDAQERFKERIRTKNWFSHWQQLRKV